jgi:hypothetical protein
MDGFFHGQLDRVDSLAFPAAAEGRALQLSVHPG